MDWLGLGVSGAVGLWAAWAFNRMVRYRQMAANAWSDIDVLLKQRHDLVPGLVDAVRGYSGFERATLEEVTRLRGMAQTAVSLPDRGAAEAALGAGLARFFALVEKYPDLKAGGLVRDLQAQLVRLEDQLQNARRYYNAVVRDHNTFLQSFPNNLLAQMLAFSAKEPFQIQEVDRSLPKVDLTS